MDEAFEIANAAGIAALLDALSELPSTPPDVAEKASALLLGLEAQTPAQPHHLQPGARRREPVRVEPAFAEALAVLFERAASLSSTPPSVAEEALDYAAALPRQSSGA